jgi:hypothetical protein
LIQSGYGYGSRNLAQYGSGYGSESTMALNLDLIRIRIHNSTGTLEDKFFQRFKIQQKRSKILAVFLVNIYYLFFFIFLPLDPDPGSGFPIRVRIHKGIESGSTTLV